MAGMIQDVGSQDFKKEVLESAVPVLVDFTAPWCGPCKTIVPQLEELASKYEGKLRVAKVNVDDNAEIAQQYRVMSLPTLFVFKGGKVADQVIGAHKSKIQAMVEKAL